MNFLWMEQREGQHKYSLVGSVRRKEHGELKNYTLNLNAYKGKERSGEKNNEK